MAPKTLKQQAEEKAKRLKQKQQRDVKKPVKVDHKKVAEKKASKLRAEKTATRVSKAVSGTAKPSGPAISLPAQTESAMVGPKVQTTGPNVGPKPFTGPRVPTSGPNMGPKPPVIQGPPVQTTGPGVGPPKPVIQGPPVPTTGPGVGPPKPLTGVQKAKGAIKTGIGRVGALTAPLAPLGVAATAYDVARSTITPEIEENQRAQVGREAAFPGSFTDTMSPEAQKRGADISIDRPGMMMGGATNQPKVIEQWDKVDPTSGEYKPEGKIPVLVGGDAQIPTTMHQYGALPEVASMVDNYVPRDATRLEMPPLEEEPPGKGGVDVTGAGFDYEFNPRTSSFDAKPYKAQNVRNVTIQDELAGASLGGLGALWAINLASKVAQGKTAANNLNETNRQKEAQSEEAWGRQRLEYDKYELDREETRMDAAMAPIEAEMKASMAALYKKQAEGTLTKDEAQNLKLSESRIKQFNEQLADIEKAAAEGTAGTPQEVAARKAQLKARLLRGEDLPIASIGKDAVPSNWIGYGGSAATETQFGTPTKLGYPAIDELQRIAK